LIKLTKFQKLSDSSFSHATIMRLESHSHI